MATTDSGNKNGLVEAVTGSGNRNGGEVEIAQRLGYLDNNSQFLIPPDQASARLELNYRQPLMRGKGRAVNESLVLLGEY